MGQTRRAWIVVVVVSPPRFPSPPPTSLPPFPTPVPPPAATRRGFGVVAAVGEDDCDVMYPMTFTHSPMLVWGGACGEERRRERSIWAAWWEEVGEEWCRVRRAVVVL